MMACYYGPSCLPMYRSAAEDISYPYPECEYCRMEGCEIKKTQTLSARNQFKGKVVEVKEGAVNAKVVVDIGCGNKVTSIITMDSLEGMGIQLGSEVTAVIKSSDVMIML